MILDARQMLGASDAEGVRAKWAENLALINKRRVAGGQAVIEIVDDDRRPVAYVNHSRWVADCPECNGGIACWPGEMPEGVCLDCGHRYRPVFPPAKDRAAAEKTLLERSRPQNRNWDPATEDVSRLKAETALLEGAV